MTRRHAFTLLEMSIVIVIIGLLLGGLVGGRNYIKNAELTSIITESKFYISMFSQFQQQYGYVPGDMPDAISQIGATNNGDGNGQILSSDDTVASTARPEIFYAFEHLNKAKLIDGSYTGATSSYGSLAALAGTNIPRISFPDSALMFDHPTALDGNVSSDLLYFDGFYGHVLRVAKISPTSTGLPDTPMLTAKQTLSLDSKFDDGRPSTGWITVPKINVGSCANDPDPASAQYATVATNSPDCYLILKVQ